MSDERVVLSSPVVAHESHQNQVFMNQTVSRETLVTNSHNEDQTSSNSSEHQQLINSRQLSEQSNRSPDSYEVKLKPQNNERSPFVV